VKIARYLLAGLSVLIALAPSLWADSVTYNFSGTLADGNTLTGQFSLNDATRQVGAFNFTSPFSAAGVTNVNYYPVVASFVGGGMFSAPNEDFTLIEFFGPLDDDFLILWFPEALASFDGGAIWTTSLPAGLFFFGAPGPEAFSPSFLQCFGDPGPPQLCNPTSSSSLFTSGAALPASEPSSLAQLAAALLSVISAARLGRLS
jgi:hypothetical protein